MEGIVYKINYNSPPIDEKELLRYAGVSYLDEQSPTAAYDVINECGDIFCYRVCYKKIPVKVVGDTLDLGFTIVKSQGLMKYLEGCECAVLFAATVGVEVDRLLRRFSVASPHRALMLQAFATERIESLCDLFEADMRNLAVSLGKRAKPRFSPGYADAPLDMQRDIFSALDCPKNIGVSLNESLMMSPTKSVTALIGFSNF